MCISKILSKSSIRIIIIDTLYYLNILQKLGRRKQFSHLKHSLQVCKFLIILFTLRFAIIFVIFLFLTYFIYLNSLENVSGSFQDQYLLIKKLNNSIISNAAKMLLT